MRRPTGAEGCRWRRRRDRDRSGRDERPRQAARAPASSYGALAADAHPHAPLDVVSFRSQRRCIRVCHRRLRRAAGPGAGARSVGRHGRLLARSHRRPLPKRRRGRCRDRDRLGVLATRLARRFVSDASGASEPRPSDERPEVIHRRRWMPGARVGRTYRRSWLRRTSSRGSCSPRSWFRRAWRTPSWPGCRRSPGSTRRSPAWSATRCSGPRGARARTRLFDLAFDPGRDHPARR